jgi:CBS domain-containing protein
VVLHGRSSRDTLVRDVMTGNVFVISPDTSAGECMVNMTERRVRHLPVLEQDALVGIVSIGDVVRAVVDAQQFTISSLESYISSGR